LSEIGREGKQSSHSRVVLCNVERSQINDLYTEKRNK
jgi:hypothetical protein